MPPRDQRSSLISTCSNQTTEHEQDVFVLDANNVRTDSQSIQEVIRLKLSKASITKLCNIFAAYSTEALEVRRSLWCKTSTVFPNRQMRIMKCT